MAGSDTEESANDRLDELLLGLHQVEQLTEHRPRRDLPAEDVALPGLLASWLLEEDVRSSRRLLAGGLDHVLDRLHDLRVGTEESHHLVEDLVLSTAKLLVADATPVSAVGHLTPPLLGQPNRHKSCGSRSRPGFRLRRRETGGARLGIRLR